MLLRFRTSNFRSLKDVQELSLVATSTKELQDSVMHRKGFQEGILRTAAIYGANASGKSNVLRALSFIGQAVRNSHRVWSPDGPIPVEPFLLSAQADPISVFEIDFLLQEIPYQYGMRLSADSVLKEWLYAYPQGRKQVWFEREGEKGRSFKFGKRLAGENKSIENITRQNSLFLSAAAQNNHELLLPIFTWLSGGIDTLFGSRSSVAHAVAEYATDRDRRETLGRMLSAADLGVVGLDLDEDLMNEKLYNAMQVFVKSLIEVVPTNPAQPTPEFSRKTPKISIRHKGPSNEGIALPETKESAGTLAYLSIVCSALEAMRKGTVLCIDELDSSLHPLLALEIVRQFNNPKVNNHGAQLIFNTHDVNLLDSTLLRRDQIWFTEKEDSGATHLYPLSDFQPRTHENLKRGYLQGRYGAVPFVESAIKGS